MVELRLEGGGRSDIVVADGEVAGVPWMLRWGPGAGPMDGLRFVAEVGDSFGVVQPLGGSPLAFAVAVVREHPVVWGLVTDDAVAVRVTSRGGDAVVESVVGPELDRSAAFVVVLRQRAEPTVIECLSRDGATLCSETVAPEPTGVADVAERIEIRPVTRDNGRAHGTVVLEGSVDDATWEYGITVSQESELQTDFQLWHPTGTGGGGGGTGPAPQPGPGRYLGVGGVGTTGDTWELSGWADPVVTEVVLVLRSGERLRVPTAGGQLALGYVVFAVALPGDAIALAAEALDARGRRVAWEDLRGRLSWVEGSVAKHREHRARALAPAPTDVQEFWHAAMGTALDAAEPANRGAGARTLVRPASRADVAGRWPIRPLLLPTHWDPRAERSVLQGEHHRWEVGQVVGVGVVWFGGPDLDDEPDPDDRVSILQRGAIILRQFVTWSEPEAVRDPPNTTVRGHPAALTELTIAENNIDLLEFRWQEQATTVGLTEPLSGVWFSAEANPRHHSVEDLRRFIEDLRSVD